MIDFLFEALCAAFFAGLGWLFWFGFIESVPAQKVRRCRPRREVHR